MKTLARLICFCTIVFPVTVFALTGYTRRITVQMNDTIVFVLFLASIYSIVTWSPSRLIGNSGEIVPDPINSNSGCSFKIIV